LKTGPYFYNPMAKFLLTFNLIFLTACSFENSTVQVGIVHSLTGTMAVSEEPVARATLMAIEEINSRGGVLGKQIEPLLYDGGSDDEQFFQITKKLLLESNVDTVFGCWTSSCRKTIKPLFEQHDKLLVYPVQYEGLERSSNILYTGATIAQQVFPALSWGLQTFGSRVLFIGSDYIYPHAANQQARQYINLLGGQVIAEQYYPLGDENLSNVVSMVEQAEVDFIFSTMNGSSNRSLFNQLSHNKNKIPIIATSISGRELEAESLDFPVYVTNSYFASLPSASNIEFVKKFRAYTQGEYNVSAAVEAAYVGVYLWAKAVEYAQSFNAGKLFSVLPAMSLNGPSDEIIVDLNGHHLWRKYYLARLNNNGEFTIEVSSNALLPPNPYPMTQSESMWDQYIESLFMQWQGQWSAPVNKAIDS